MDSAKYVSKMYKGGLSETFANIFGHCLPEEDIQPRQRSGSKVSTDHDILGTLPASNVFALKKCGIDETGSKLENNISVTTFDRDEQFKIDLKLEIEKELLKRDEDFREQFKIERERADERFLSEIDDLKILIMDGIRGIQEKIAKLEEELQKAENDKSDVALTKRLSFSDFASSLISDGLSLNPNPPTSQPSAATTIESTENNLEGSTAINVKRKTIRKPKRIIVRLPCCHKKSKSCRKMNSNTSMVSISQPNAIDQGVIINDISEDGSTNYSQEFERVWEEQKETIETVKKKILEKIVNEVKEQFIQDIISSAVENMNNEMEALHEKLEKDSIK